MARQKQIPFTAQQVLRTAKPVTTEKGREAPAGVRVRVMGISGNKIRAKVDDPNRVRLSGSRIVAAPSNFVPVTRGRPRVPRRGRPPLEQ